MPQQAVTRNRRWSLTVSDNRWLFAAFLLTMAVSAALLFLPLAEGAVVGAPMEAGQPAGTVETTDRESLLEVAGCHAVKDPPADRAAARQRLAGCSRIEVLDSAPVRWRPPVASQPERVSWPSHSSARRQPSRVG